MKGGKGNVPPVGELRQSQLVGTFGPGSLLDLPEHSVIVSGLDFWHGEMREIHEERLAAELSQMFGRTIALREPPHKDESAGVRQRRGVKVFRFPNWYVAQVEAEWTDPSGRSFRTRPLVRGRDLRGGSKYLGDQGKKHNVVPVRFVRACPRGHIADIDWYAFVQRSADAPMKGELWLDEGGAANDFREIHVRLMLGGAVLARRALADAVKPGIKALGRCKGYAPWLGAQVRESCAETMKLLPRGATHSYFVQSRRVISIPDGSSALREAVNEVYESYLESADGVDEVAFYRKKFERVRAAIAPYDDAVVWAEVERRKSKTNAAPKGARDYKRDEIETFRHPPHGKGVNEPDFTADVLSEKAIPKKLRPLIERIVLVRRLREVVAQYGFTRFEDGVADVIPGGPPTGVQPAHLAEEPTWCPAVENRGEGVFLGFHDAAFTAWREKAKDAIGEREARFGEAFKLWKAQRDIKSDHPFPGLELVLLHSFSHLLLTAVALECGYSASSLRERVYAGPSGHGVLLYTASPGAEGTLGGLVDVGKNLERHIERALELGRTCSNDPICAQHDPQDSREERYRHGAACHGCLLIAETSCEMRNEYLDRSLVVRTADGLGCELFED